MELAVAIKGRRSIRKFKAQDVPKNVITEILEVARWSPSWGNTQPWDLYVLTGKTLAKFKEMNLKQTLAGAAIVSDVPMLEKWPDAMKARYGELGKIVLSAQGIKREDKEARDKYYQNMVSMFDTPCLILACISRDNLVEYQMLDIGLIAQTICLAAHDKLERLPQFLMIKKLSWASLWAIPIRHSLSTISRGKERNWMNLSIGWNKQ
jgi:nitroreductase